MDRPRFGVVYAIDEDKQAGWVLLQDSTSVRFRLACYYGDLPRTLPQPIEVNQYQEELTPKGQLYITALSPIQVRPEQEGRIEYMGGRHGFIELSNGRKTYFHEYAVPSFHALRPGDFVACHCVSGREGRDFALAVKKTGDPNMPRPFRRVGASVGAVGRRGEGKDMNDDSFLVHEISAGMWLLAVADGASNPGQGWWASAKAIEVLFNTVPDFQTRLADEDGHGGVEKLMREWVERVRAGVDSAQRRESRDDYRNSRTTLSVVLVKGRHFYWVLSGDSPILTVRQHARLVDDATDVPFLNDSSWRPLFGNQAIKRNQVLLLCTDGVVKPGAENHAQRLHILQTAFEPPQKVGPRQKQESLEIRVKTAVELIGNDGEKDDVTIVAFEQVGR